MSEAAETLDGLFSGGAWRAGGGEPLEVKSPVDERVIARVATATPAQAEEALRAARDAQRPWAARSAVQRAAFLTALADLLEADADGMAATITAEMGKPRAQALGEVGFAVGILRYTAEWARRIQGEIVPSDDPGEAIHLLRVPIGVVTAILPWNFPLALFARKAAPALLTGNAVVVKPSELTPGVALRFARLAERAELPAGTLNVVVGDAATGASLVASPLTSMVTLTGSTRAGKAVMAAAAEHLTRVSLELGGKAPAIVWADADLDAAIDAVVQARHLNAGQVCTCAERVFVHESVHDAFVAGYAERVRTLRVGDPSGEVDLGPLVSAAQRAKVVAATDEALAEGASAVVAGGRPEGSAFARGHWLSPTVLTDVQPRMRVMREEVFGPVTPIARVRSLQEAIDAVNGSRYALAAYLFSNDHALVMRAAQQLDCGELYVNRSIGEALQAHHSGHKESGIGGEDGLHGVLKYTQIRSVYHRYGHDGV
jgi:lactaldehyde dehydrogenase/glycolaldehyde dehydrogenase